MTHDYEYDYDLASTCCEKPICIECQTVQFLSDNRLWELWSEKQSCSDNATAWRTIDSTYEAEMNEVKFPSCIRDQDVIDSFLHPELCTFPTDVQSIAENTEEDPCKLKTIAPQLGDEWQGHVKYCSSPSEAAVRTAGDFIIKAHLSCNGGHSMNICMVESYSPRRKNAESPCRHEARLVLPRCDGVPSPYVAVADGVVFTTLDATQFPAIGEDFAFQWSDSDVPWRHEPISFVFEAGSASKSGETNRRQLVTYFTTGLKHRRAVGMKDAPLYGATLLGERFTLYVAVWRDDKIVVHSTGHYWFFSRAI